MDDNDLHYIETYDIFSEGALKLIEHLKNIWHWHDFIEWDGKNLALHTGGWSENEEIIMALQNTTFWAICWEKSERGGHYYFSVPRSFLK